MGTLALAELRRIALRVLRFLAVAVAFAAIISFFGLLELTVDWSR